MVNQDNILTIYIVLQEIYSKNTHNLHLIGDVNESKNMHQ